MVRRIIEVYYARTWSAWLDELKGLLIEKGTKKQRTAKSQSTCRLLELRSQKTETKKAKQLNIKILRVEQEMNRAPIFGCSSIEQYMDILELR